jgi:hypothetical protein
MRFAFFQEVVLLSTERTVNEGIAGLVGAIMGVSHYDDGRVYYYFAEDGVGGFEDELESTGRFFERADFYSGRSARVSQDGELLNDGPNDLDEG